MKDNERESSKTTKGSMHKPRVMTQEELAKHPSLRRKTKSYRAKRGYVRDLWIYSGLLVIFMPLAAQLLSLATLVFVSFSILDDEAGAC